MENGYGHTRKVAQHWLTPLHPLSVLKNSQGIKVLVLYSEVAAIIFLFLPFPELGKSSMKKSWQPEV